MRACVLFYNLSEKKSLAIKTACIQNGIAVRVVQPAEFSLPLRTLLEQSPVSVSAETPAFSQEMLVFSSLSPKQLDALLPRIRKAGGIALKAVITPTNLDWTSLQLVQELQAEHAALAQQNQSIHTDV